MTATKQTVLAELQAYYEKKIAPAQAAVYLRVLGDVDPVRLQAAADTWMRKSEWFPRANQLLGCYDDTQPTEDSAPSRLDTVDKMWMVSNSFGVPVCEGPYKLDETEKSHAEIDNEYAWMLLTDNNGYPLK